MNKVLIVVAHPDDEVLGCGATIAKHTKKGDIVKVIFMTNGFGSREAGSHRHTSAEDASKILGCSSPLFMEFPDNQMDSIPLLEIVKEIEKVVCEFSPSIIYTHHFGDLNVDHQITHRAVMTAARPEPNCCVKKIYSFETLSATYWQSLSMAHTFTPNHFVDVTDYLLQKNEALACYNEEMRKYHHARSYETVDLLAAFRGSIVGLKSAEAFVVERSIEQ